MLPQTSPYAPQTEKPRPFGPIGPPARDLDVCDYTRIPVVFLSSHLSFLLTEKKKDFFLPISSLYLLSFPSPICSLSLLLSFFLLFVAFFILPFLLPPFFPPFPFLSSPFFLYPFSSLSFFLFFLPSLLNLLKFYLNVSSSSI